MLNVNRDTKHVIHYSALSAFKLPESPFYKWDLLIPERLLPRNEIFKANKGLMFCPHSNEG